MSAFKKTAIVLACVGLFHAGQLCRAANAPESVGGTVLSYRVADPTNFPVTRYVARWLRNDGTFTDISSYRTTSHAAMVPGRISSGHYVYSRNGADALIRFTSDDPASPTEFGWMQLHFETETTGSEEVDEAGLTPANPAAGVMPAPAHQTFTLRPAAPMSGATNVSNRTYVDANNPGIAGFILTSDTPRFVLLRAVGPSLAAFDVPHPLADPYLEAHSGSTPSDRIVGWGLPRFALDPSANLSHAARVAGAFELDPKKGDSVWLVELQPGAHTVVVGSQSGTSSGTALIEVYFLP